MHGIFSCEKGWRKNSDGYVGKCFSGENNVCRIWTRKTTLSLEYDQSTGLRYPSFKIKMYQISGFSM